MNHLEQLIGEWYEYRGYFVRKNIKVGKLKRGGWEGELDVVVFNPEKEHILHIEASIDANPWKRREKSFRRKFAAGQKYIPELFPWVDSRTIIEQKAIIWASDKNRKTVGGAEIVPIWKFVQNISAEIMGLGKPQSNMISEAFPLLRTIQFVANWTKPKQ